MSYKRGSINEIVGSILGGIARRVVEYPLRIVGGAAQGAIQGVGAIKQGIQKGKENNAAKAETKKAPVKKGKLPKKPTAPVKEPEETKE